MEDEERVRGTGRIRCSSGDTGETNAQEKPREDVFRETD